jgi:hypothetical protein
LKNVQQDQRDEKFPVRPPGKADGFDYHRKEVPVFHVTLNKIYLSYELKSVTRPRR